MVTSAVVLTPQAMVQGRYAVVVVIEYYNVIYAPQSKVWEHCVVLYMHLRLWYVYSSLYYGHLRLENTRTSGCGMGTTVCSMATLSCDMGTSDWSMDTLCCAAIWEPNCVVLSLQAVV